MFKNFVPRRKSKEKILYQDRVFTKEVLDNFTVGGSKGFVEVIQNVKFDNCKSNAPHFFKGSKFSNVEFKNCKFNERLTIDSEVLLENVVFTGNNPKELFIVPREKGQENQERYDLDISKYDGEVNIIGVDIRKVKIDNEKHVRIFLDKFDDINLKELIPDGLNFWRIITRKISGVGANQGIYSLPNTNAEEIAEYSEYADYFRSKFIIE